MRSDFVPTRIIIARPRPGGHVPDTRLLRLGAISVLGGVVLALLARIALQYGSAIILGLARQPATGALSLTAWLLSVTVAEGFGGYMARRFAGAHVMAAPLLVGIVDLVVSSAVLLYGPKVISWSWYLASLVLIVPAAVLGGRLARRRA